MKTVWNSLCDEIGELLGDPTPSESIMEKLEKQWQTTTKSDENIQQLLSVLSGFYKAGFVVSNDKDSCHVKSYFLEDSKIPEKALWEETFVRFTPRIGPREDGLKPKKIDAIPVLEALDLRNLDWAKEALDPAAFHFLVDPERSLSLILISDTPEPARRELVLKTQALIQRHFYD